MSGSVEMVRVVNKQARLIELPAIPGAKGRQAWPAARLIPGGNNVPAEYLAAVAELPGRPGDLFRMLMDTAIVLDTAPNATAKPEGPEPPASLTGYKPAAAMRLIDGETRIDVLGKWAKTERRKNVKLALATRIASLGGNSAGLVKSAASDTDDESGED